MDEATRTQVAIRYLSDRFRSDAPFINRLRIEAEALARLEDDNLVDFYAYVEEPGGAAIVTELVDGVSLRRVLATQGPTGPLAALTVFGGSLLALAAAHGAGLVHRAYKPENVLIRRDGLAKVSDLGLLVETGGAIDAAGYLAPELWGGSLPSVGSDLYAATAVFFECLTGRPPYAARKPMDLARAHQSTPIPVEAVPGPLQALIARGLAKSPADRPGSAADLLAELDDAAIAAYGSSWESQGRDRLAEMMVAAERAPDPQPDRKRSARARTRGTTEAAAYAAGGRGGTADEPTGRAARKGRRGAADRGFTKESMFGDPDTARDSRAAEGTDSQGSAAAGGLRGNAEGQDLGGAAGGARRGGAEGQSPGAGDGGHAGTRRRGGARGQDSGARTAAGYPGTDAAEGTDDRGSGADPRGGRHSSAGGRGARTVAKESGRRGGADEETAFAGSGAAASAGAGYARGAGGAYETLADAEADRTRTGTGGHPGHGGAHREGKRRGVLIGTVVAVGAVLAAGGTIWAVKGGGPAAATGHSPAPPTTPPVTSDGKTSQPVTAASVAEQITAALAGKPAASFTYRGPGGPGGASDTIQATGVLRYAAKTPGAYDMTVSNPGDRKFGRALRTVVVGGTAYVASKGWKKAPAVRTAGVKADLPHVYAVMAANARWASSPAGVLGILHAAGSDFQADGSTYSGTASLGQLAQAAGVAPFYGAFDGSKFTLSYTLRLGADTLPEQLDVRIAPVGKGAPVVLHTTYSRWNGKTSVTAPIR
jgi:hypothetical protein